MSRNNRYPRMGQWRPYKPTQYSSQPAPGCECCGTQSVGSVVMQESWFRGEDEDYKVCERHHIMARDNVKLFYDDYRRNKEKKA
jgi:hypothetical protein